MAEHPHPVVLLAAEQIHARVQALAAEIRQDAPGPLLAVAVLKGAFIFAADLVRALHGPIALDFVAVSSYADGTTSSGEVRLLKDLELPIDGQDVLIIDDIVDSGLTLEYLQAMLRARCPRSIRTACLLSKPGRRRAAVPVDYVGFEIPDRFVVGYGLDHAEGYRNLPYLATLD